MPFLSSFQQFILMSLNAIFAFNTSFCKKLESEQKSNEIKQYMHHVL